MKVIYKDRIFLDKYRCIDKTKTRYFDKSWVVGGLTYFKRGEFDIFSIATDEIIKIEKDVEKTNNYNIYVDTETEKYNIIQLVREAGGKITGVSGCGTGYYIQIQATSEQAFLINKKLGGAA